MIIIIVTTTTSRANKQAEEKKLFGCDLAMIARVGTLALRQSEVSLIDIRKWMEWTLPVLNFAYQPWYLKEFSIAISR